MSDIADTRRPSNIGMTHKSRWLSRLIARLCDAHANTEQAHTQRRLYDHHPDAAFHDAGVSRDDAQGIANHQPALPFFLQSGFGRR